MTEGPVMVIAGPGTGKTQIITLRIAYILLNTHANANNILALTFTENAAAEMKERLFELIGSDAYKVNIHTFHAFCNELIQKNNRIFHHLLSYEPVSDLDRIETVRDIIESDMYQFLRPQGSPSYYYHPALSAISALKKEGITPSTFSTAVNRWKSDFEKRDDLIHTKGKYNGKMKGEAREELRHIEQSEEFGKVYARYQVELLRRKLYDYEDMILEVLRALRSNEDFLATTRETFHYILVDEHQDTNDAQNAIIELVCGLDNHPNLFVVGDEKQSIFRFQGASLENFLYFQKLYPKATLIHLQENYRSTQTILDTAHTFIRHNPKSISSDTLLQARKNNDDKKINITQFADVNQEQMAIAEAVIKLHEEGMRYNDIAVLYKKNDDIYTLARLFDKVGIPYQLSTPESLFDDFYIQKLLTLLRSIHMAGDDIPFARVFLMDIFAVNPIDFFKAQNLSSKKKESLWTIIQNGDSSISSSIIDVGKKIANWKKESVNTPIDIFFLKVLHESGLFTRILNQQNSLVILHKLGVVYEDIKALQKKNHSACLDDYINHIDLLILHNIQPRSTAIAVAPDKVTISTVHKAKGLEYVCVFIPSLTEGYWGGGRSRSALLHIPWQYLSRTHVPSMPSDDLEEERRLFYVALTRAKKYIYLSYASHDKNGKISPPSQFIHELPTSHVQTTSHSETDEVTKHRLITELTPAEPMHSSLTKAEMQLYIMDRFTKNGLSVSALNNFIICPWRYVFRNLIRIPDTLGYHLLLGTTIHAVIREYIVQIKKGTRPSLSDLLEYMNTMIDRFSASEKDVLKLKEQGRLIIESYFQKRMSSWDTRREAEVIIPNIALKEGVFLNGKIDMIEINKDKTITVYDFKTGKSKSRNAIMGMTQNKDGSYFRQLVFYKMLLDAYKHGTYAMNQGVIEFVESSIEGDIKQEVFTITKDDVERVQKEIGDMKTALSTLSFWNKKCDDKDCEYCAYQSHIIHSFRE